MPALLIVHLIAVSLWGGIVVTELVLELVPRQNIATHEFVARTHYWIDLLLELPAIGLVIITGAVLTVDAWPVPALYWVHVSAAAVAIGANLFCVTQVVGRHRCASQDERLAHDRRIRAAVAGVPFAFVAVVVGFALAGH